MRIVHLEPLLATGYAMLLVVIAAGLEWMARHSQSPRGSISHPRLSFSQGCESIGNVLWATRLQMAEIDHELRVMHYRAPARTCNGCSMKPDCTDSDGGRTISVPMDPWVSSAIGRFHRGISLSVLVLAGLIIAIELFRHNHGMELLVLVAVMFMVSLLGLNLARGLQGHSGS